MANLIEKGFGLSPTGFNRPRLPDLMDRSEELYRESESFGSDFSFTSDKVIYQLTSVINKNIADKMEILEQLYNNSTPLKASGVPLFQKGSFVGITRGQASKAEVKIKFIGDIGTQIPTGQQVKTIDGLIFVVTNGDTIVNGTEIILDAIAQESGSKYNVATNTIVQLVTPIPNITSVTNPIAATKGDNQELETSFRNRYYSKLRQSTGNNVDGIATAIKELEGIKSSVVYENTTDVEVNGIPPHSIAPYVVGGDGSNIASAIFRVKAGGIRSYGTTIINVKDTQDLTHTIGFSRPTYIPIYVKITLTKTSKYPVGADDKIKDIIVAYITNLDISTDVYTYQIVSRIVSLGLEGIESIVVEISKDNSTFKNDIISIGKDEIATTDTGKVVIVNV